MRRALKIVGLVLLLVIAGVAVFLWTQHEPRPEGEPGPRADALAREVEAAVNKSAWDATLAVRWTFADRHHHLWDRKRHWARVRWGDNEALVDLNTQQGVAWRAGQPLQGEARDEAVHEAYAYWVNDAFWLNPLAKLFDPGVVRSIVRDEAAGEQLLVSYTSGGLTPGDAYLWQLGPARRPVSWRMWVSVIPIGGTLSTWEGWQSLATGALVATQHRSAGITLTLSDVEGAASLEQLEPGPDPFTALSPR